MLPATNNTTGNDELDPQVVNLAKAIRETETRGQKDPYTARGASGEFGAYQYTKPTWEADSQAFLGKVVPLEQADKLTQNEVAYKKLKSLKDQGYNPAQIASIWNSGKPEWEGNKGVNKHGVKYDVPQYVDSVTKSYQALKQGQQPTIQPVASTVGNEQYDVNPATEILKGVAKSGLEATYGSSLFAHPLVQANQTPEQKETVKKYITDPLESRNAYQTGGKIAGTIAQIAIPGTVPNAAMKGVTFAQKARQAWKAPADALEIVAPKETARTLKEAIKQGRTKTEGFFRAETMTPDQRTQRAAKAVEELVSSGKMGVKRSVSENANAIRNAIQEEAEGLVSQIKNQDVKYILQPEELNGLLTNAVNRIGENPTMVGDAAASAEKILTKFKSYLPKGRDVTADDLFEARKKLDAWVKEIKGDSIFDPAKENAISIALRAVRQEANDLIASKVPDVAFKESLAKQSALYDALENVAMKGAKDIGTTAPKRFFDRHPIVKSVVQQGLSGLIPAGIGGYLGAKITGD